MALGGMVAAYEKPNAESTPEEMAALTETAPAADETPEVIEEAIEPIRVSMEFQDANLKDVLKTFSQQTGINMIAGAEVGDQPITLYLEDVAPLDALDQILKAGNLTYERPLGSEIYIVGPMLEEPRTITRVYRLRYARVSQSVLAKAAATFASRTPFEGGLAAVGEGGGQAAAGGGALGGVGGGEEVGIDVVLEGLLTDVGSVVVDGRTNSLMLTDIPENFPRFEAALAALDIRTPQIMIEAEVIETTLSKLKDLGVEWGSTVVTLTPGSRDTRFPFSFLQGRRRAPTGQTAFTTSKLDFSSFKGILKALEKDTDSKILARPKILTLDNEPALIRLTTDEAIGFESTVGEIQSTSEPERTITGIVLVVTPQVNENNYITMLVEPSVAKTVASKITPPSGQATPRDPKTRSSWTMVRIRSGDTLVVGGLIDRSEEEVIQRVPILSGIPFIGEAFKNLDIDNTASELIVFVTPRILDEPTETQIAAVGETPLGLREQEPLGARQEVIERTLNVLEQSKL